jgi:nucleotide-binding universal stress UspA family protein
VLRILLAVDGSECAVRATRKLVDGAAAYKESPQVELVTVHLPVPHVGGFSGVVVSHEMIEQHYREEGEKALAPSKQILDQAKIRFTPHILVGDITKAIVEQADKSRCDMIYMGTRGMSAVPNMLVGSIATKVLHLARVPVVLVH